MDFGLYPEINRPNEDIAQQLAECFFINKNHRIELKKGSVIDHRFHGSFILLYKGKFSMSIISKTGVERILWFIDEMNILFDAPTDETFCAILRACEDCILYSITKEELFHYIGGNAHFINYLLETGRKRGMITGDRLHSITSETSRCRVLKFIHQLSVTYGEKAGGNSVFVTKFPVHNEIASLLGVHRTNVTKYISFLEHEEVIKKHARGFLVNIAVLENMIEDEFMES